MDELRPSLTTTSLSSVCRTVGSPELPGEVTGLSLDTRLVKPGDLFVALPGEHTHGARFAHAAVDAGAAAILTDGAGRDTIGTIGVPVIVAEQPRPLVGSLAQLIYPGPRPSLIGVTGTNGKTTTTHVIEAAADAAGIATAVVGTLGVRFGQYHAYSGRTTPEAPSLHAALAALSEKGAQLAAMEVSSHALVLHRVDGLLFDVAVFLGLSQDHLDFHGSMEAYFEAKASLFTSQRSRQAVINIDDDWGRRLAARCEVPFTTFGVRAKDAQWTAQNVSSGDIMSFTAQGPDVALAVSIPMPGMFNVSNALAALAALSALGLDVTPAAQGIARVTVPGRLERISNSRGVAAFVDYAHTPDAVERVLDVITASTEGKVITVLGCGGDRDPAKRPLMGRAASAASTLLIVTDDNPRSEDPSAIRQQMMTGVQHGAQVREVADRREAIRAAVAAAASGDSIIVLGKGHETGQEIAGVIHPFDDRDELRLALGSVS